VALSILQAEAERARALITHRFPLAGVQEAFRTAADKSTRCLKVHVCP
jgi:threonine dehydrogenase-like Zn-dependent dehydrogenase